MTPERQAELRKENNDDTKVWSDVIATEAMNECLDAIAERDRRIAELESKFQESANRAAKCIDELNLKIAELEAAQRWIYVAEKLPEIMKRTMDNLCGPDTILFRCFGDSRVHKGKCMETGFNDGSGPLFEGVGDGNARWASEVECWLLLPQPPETK